MNIETKTFLYTLIFGIALIAIGITLLKTKKSVDKERNFNYRLCGIFSLAIGIMFCIYRTLIFFIPQVAEYAAIFILLTIIVINIILFRAWRNRGKK